MKTYDLTDDEGRLLAFEVSNAFLSRKTACRIAQQIPDAILVRGPRICASEDEFCEFEFEGVRFVLWEPWGDNNRYWIGPKPERWVPQTARVLEEFAKWHLFHFFDDWAAHLWRLF